MPECFRRVAFNRLKGFRTNAVARKLVQGSLEHIRREMTEIGLMPLTHQSVEHGRVIISAKRDAFFPARIGSRSDVNRTIYDVVVDRIPRNKRGAIN